MKLAYKDIAATAEIDMSPMIDMVFLLLIFFIVASQFVDTKPVVDIPEAEAGVVPTEITNRLMISVKQNGSYYMGNEETPSDLEAVSQRIAEEYEGNENLRVLIRADASTRYEVNKRIMETCADIGANNLVFATIQN